jgi:hypothetical protein
MTILITGGGGLVGNAIKYLRQHYPDYKFTNLEDGLDLTIKWFKENSNFIRN